MPQRTIAERIQQDLHSSHYPALKNILATVDDELITLSGSVSMFYHLQQAICIAKKHAPRFTYHIEVS